MLAHANRIDKLDQALGWLTQILRLALCLLIKAPIAFVGIIATKLAKLIAHQIGDAPTRAFEWLLFDQKANAHQQKKQHKHAKADQKIWQ